MSATRFWRLIWKQYRQQRACWALITCLVPLFPLFLVINAQPDSFFSAAMAAPVLFALVSGAASFAAEYEAGTFPFQRSMPLSVTQLLARKLFSAVIGIAVLGYSAGQLLSMLCRSGIVAVVASL